MKRIVRGLPGTLSLDVTVNDTPTDMDVPPTVTVTAATGVQVATGTTTRTGLGAYTYALPPQAQLSNLTATWTGKISGTDVTLYTYAEIVGAEYFSVAELRASDSVLTNTTKYPDSKLIDMRLSVESDFEQFCNRAFVPRYARDKTVGDGTGRLWLSRPEPIRLISLTVNGVDWSAKTFTVPEDNLRVIDLDGDFWPRFQQVIIEYEYGSQVTPIPIKNAAIKYAKYRLVSDQSRIDERATTMSIPDFGNFALSTPGRGDALTGIPSVDVTLWNYALDVT